VNIYLYIPHHLYLCLGI